MNKLPTILISFLVLVSLSACGKSGAPKAPENLAPGAARFFTAKGNSDGVQLTWMPPQTKAQGDLLDDLDTFLIRRSVIVEGKKVEKRTIAEVRYDITAGPSGLEKQLVYKDRTVKPGVIYEYGILPVNEDGQKGIPGPIVRVTYRGEASLVEVY